MTATGLFDPASVTVLTAQQLLARHLRLNGDDARCGRCAGAWPCPPAVRAGEVCRAAGLVDPNSLDDAFTDIRSGRWVNEETQPLALLEGPPRRQPGRALSALIERTVEQPR